MANEDALQSQSGPAALVRNKGQATNIGVLRSTARGGADLVSNEETGVITGLKIEDSHVDGRIDVDAFVSELRAALKDERPETAYEFIQAAKDATSSDDAVKGAAWKNVVRFARDVFVGAVAETISHLCVKYLGHDPLHG